MLYFLLSEIWTKKKHQNYEFFNESHYVQASWNLANKKQQEKLLELIRRLAEDDKEGVIAHKVCMFVYCLEGDVG